MGIALHCAMHEIELMVLLSEFCHIFMFNPVNAFKMLRI